MMTVVVAVGAGVGDVETDGFGVALALALADGEAPGLHDAGDGNGEAVVFGVAVGDGEGTVAAVEPAALNVVVKIPPNNNAAEIEAITRRIRFDDIMYVTLTVSTRPT